MEDPQRGDTKRQPSLVQPSSPGLTYVQLLADYRDYRWFIISYFITQFAEWSLYIGSLDFIEHASTESKSRTSVSLIIIARLIPNALLTCFGGTVADSMDRRRIMLLLNLGGALCVLWFVLAYEYQSLPLLYVASMCQQCVAGLYQPSHSAIIPQMVRNEPQALKKATTLEGLTWSFTAAFGAAVSGLLIGYFGIEFCFLFAGASYLISALCLWMVQGDYSVPGNECSNKQNPWEHLKSMTVDGASYLSSSCFGALILLKTFIGVTNGACDILAVVFSEQSPHAHEVHGELDEKQSNMRLGILFAATGLGSLLGPLLTEPFINAEKMSTVQLSCVICYGVTALGFVGWSVPGSPFWAIVVWSVVRAAGTSTVWINSNLLLQSSSSDRMMGRVMAFDYALVLITEAGTSFAWGALMDSGDGLNAPDMSLIFSVLMGVCTIFWSWYHVTGHGARNRPNSLANERDTSEHAALDDASETSDETTGLLSRTSSEDDASASVNLLYV